MTSKPADPIKEAEKKELYRIKIYLKHLHAGIRRLK